MRPICGPRYKCLVCPDFDLCRNCEASGMHVQHDMMKITAPGQFPGGFPGFPFCGPPGPHGQGPQGPGVCFCLFLLLFVLILFHFYLKFYSFLVILKM